MIFFFSLIFILIFHAADRPFVLFPAKRSITRHLDKSTSNYCGAGLLFRRYGLSYLVNVILHHCRKLVSSHKSPMRPVLTLKWHTGVTAKIRIVYRTNAQNTRFSLDLDNSLLRFSPANYVDVDGDDKT